MTNSKIAPGFYLQIIGPVDVTYTGPFDTMASAENYVKTIPSHFEVYGPFTAVDVKKQNAEFGDCPVFAPY